MDEIPQTLFQAKVCEFALSELVRQHRNSFDPLWTVESWAKFLIWVALNCGVTGEKDLLENFAKSLGPGLANRMRRIYFERVLTDQDVRILADPADPQILVMPLDQSIQPTLDQTALALEQVNLIEKVNLDRSYWKTLDSIIAIPWSAK